jgi:hypothetical protein
MLGLFFLRILAYPIYRRIVQITVGIFTVYSIAYFFFVIFQCGTPQGEIYWTHRVEGKCIPYHVGLTLSYTHAALTSGTDLMFVCLPIALMRQVRLNVRDKITVITILSVGAVGCAASFIRINYIWVFGSTSESFFCKLLAGDISEGVAHIIRQYAILGHLVCCRAWYRYHCRFSCDYSSFIPSRFETRTCE